MWVFLQILYMMYVLILAFLRTSSASIPRIAAISWATKFAIPGCESFELGTCKDIDFVYINPDVPFNK